MKVTFKLIHTESNEQIKESFYLLDIYNYIRLNINDPRNYSVEEFTGNNLEFICSAYYLIENYGALSLPLTLSEL